MFLVGLLVVTILMEFGRVLELRKTSSSTDAQGSPDGDQASDQVQREGVNIVGVLLQQRRSKRGHVRDSSVSGLTVRATVQDLALGGLTNAIYSVQVFTAGSGRTEKAGDEGLAAEGLRRESGLSLAPLWTRNVHEIVCNLKGIINGNAVIGRWAGPLD